MPLSIGHLCEMPHHRATVAAWIYDAFWRDRPGYRVATFEGYLRDAGDPDRIPLSLLATVDGSPAGTINLIENDDSARPHLRPWLAALFVAPDHRRAGVASALVHALAGHASRLGLAELYLGTDIPLFYQQFGAETVERDGTHHVMRLPVDSASGQTDWRL